MWHRIDEKSPLWRMRDTLKSHVDGLEITVTAFDTASLQPVMFYKRYEKADIVPDMVFESNLKVAHKGQGTHPEAHTKRAAPSACRA